MNFVREVRPNKEQERRTYSKVVPCESPTEPYKKAKRPRKRPEFVTLPTGGAITA
jgi:hypothetical protein